MFDLSYRVATALSLSPKASERLCRQILHQTRSWHDARTLPVGRPGDGTGRRVRGRLLVALRSMVGPQVDPNRLEQALDAAVLADELALLPPRQRATIRWTMQRRCTVRQITERMGWTPQQVARLLRAGLTTLAVCDHR